RAGGRDRRGHRLAHGPVSAQGARDEGRLVTSRPAAAGAAATVAALLSLCPPFLRAATPDDPNQAPEASGVEERIQVLEEPWKVGDVKTYSLIFDYAPFGRQTIRLDRILEQNGEKILEFSQMLHLDLRALGQEGSLYNFGTIRYAR